ncbi:MAG: alpha/beta hydrolase [Gemmataceae bacterium]
MQADAELFVIESFIASTATDAISAATPQAGQARWWRSTASRATAVGMPGRAGTWARAGVEVLFLDRRGSGPNQQVGDTPSHRRLIADLDEFIGAVCPTPPFLLAISWGAKLAVGLSTGCPAAAGVDSSRRASARASACRWAMLAIGQRGCSRPGSASQSHWTSRSCSRRRRSGWEFWQGDPLALHGGDKRASWSPAGSSTGCRARAHMKIRAGAVAAGRPRPHHRQRADEGHVKLFLTYDCQWSSTSVPATRWSSSRTCSVTTATRARWLELHNALAREPVLLGVFVPIGTPARRGISRVCTSTSTTPPTSACASAPPTWTRSSPRPARR